MNTMESHFSYIFFIVYGDTPSRSSTVNLPDMFKFMVGFSEAQCFLEAGPREEGEALLASSTNNRVVRSGARL